MKTPLLVALALLPSLALAASNPATTSPTANQPSPTHLTTTSPAATNPVTTPPASTSPSATSPTTTEANSTIPDPTEELKVMTERLQLSPCQQNAIKPILVAEFDKRKSIQDNTSLSDQQKHDQTGTVHRASLKQIQALFTPGQNALIAQQQSNPSPSPTSTAPAPAK